MVWNVIDYKKGQLSFYNVFNSCSFRKTVEEELMALPPKLILSLAEESECTKVRHYFGKILRTAAIRQFAGRCEYELLISDWPCTNEYLNRKIDVYHQLLANWDRFVDYVVDCYIECWATKISVDDSKLFLFFT